MKMSPEQHFIVASTSAVMEGILDARETDEINFDQLDMYSQSMATRERTLREFCDGNMKCPRISLLRFGTVIGSSKGQRTDLLVPD
jgi:nucleoside-diphosphate-sugar epimerase